jgi:hypothetical protein
VTCLCRSDDDEGEDAEDGVAAEGGKKKRKKVRTGATLRATPPMGGCLGMSCDAACAERADD